MIVALLLGIRFFKWEAPAGRSTGVASAGARRRPLRRDVLPVVRPATEADVPALNAIYNTYIVDSHVSFDTEPWTDAAAPGNGIRRSDRVPTTPS